jgi:ribose transport system permease protein
MNRRTARTGRAGDLLERYALVGVLALIIAFFAITQTDTFWTAANFRNVIGNESVLVLAALAVMVPLLAGQLDLSIGANLGICSIATAAAMSRFSVAWPLAIVIGIGLGVAIGAISGVLVTRLGMPSLITTLGIATVISGVVQWYTEGRAIIGKIPTSFTKLGSGTWLGIPKPLYYVVVVAVALWYLLEHTPFGRYLSAIGASREAARLVGLPVERLVLAGFALAGGLAGIGGVLQTARLGNGSPQQSIAQFVLPALAAAYVGATAFEPGRFNVAGTVLAVFVVKVLINGLLFAGVKPWVNDVVTGLALLAAVALSSWFARRRRGG